MRLNVFFIFKKVVFKCEIYIHMETNATLQYEIQGQEGLLETDNKIITERNTSPTAFN